jgi:hypothetical protein
MTWKQALEKSIEKWDKVCFEGSYSDCALCEKDNSIWLLNENADICEKCPVSMTGNCCENENSLWKNTSDLKQRTRTHFRWGTNADFQMYFFLCMLYHEYYGEAK